MSNYIRKRSVSGSIYRTGRLMLFTLIELLTVLAIITLLATLLLPALTMAREKSKEIVCAGNLKQLGAVIALYADSFNGRMPPAYNPQAGFGYYAKYFNREGLLSSDDITICPSWGAGINDQPPLRNGNFYSVSYAIPYIRVWLTAFGSFDLTGDGWIGHTTPLESIPYHPLLANGFSGLALLMDGAPSSVDPARTHELINLIKATQVLQAARHSGRTRMNVLFFDIHVQSMNYNNVVDNTKLYKTE